MGVLIWTVIFAAAMAQEAAVDAPVGAVEDATSPAVHVEVVRDAPASAPEPTPSESGAPSEGTSPDEPSPEAGETESPETADDVPDATVSPKPAEEEGSPTVAEPATPSGDRPAPAPVYTPVPVPPYNPWWASPAPTPAVNTSVPPAAPASEGAVDRTAGLLPWIEVRGFSGGLILALGAVALLFLARILARIQNDLERSGALPRLSRVAENLSRLGAVVLGLGAAAAWIPANLAPVMQWTLIAAAVGLGWSLRVWLQDWVAWTVLASNRHLRVGRWVRVGSYEGEVVNIGLRTTLLVADGGRRVSVPNRLLVASPVVREFERWPMFRFEVRLPEIEDRGRVRRLLYEAVASSPWVGDGQARVESDTADPERWWVEVPLLSGVYQSAFRGNLRERVMTALSGSGSTEAGSGG